MQLGMVGLGRMGANMVRRLIRGGHECVVWDFSADTVKQLAGEGATGSHLARRSRLRNSTGRAPSGLWFPRATPPKKPSTILAKRDRRRATSSSMAATRILKTMCAAPNAIRTKASITSTSGPAAESGASTWLLHDDWRSGRSSRAHLDPIFKTLAPGRGDIARTPGREKRRSTAEHGYLHCGPSGAGHFVKMVHNGIEYGLMQAYAEGFDIFRNANSESSARGYSLQPRPRRYRGSLAPRKCGSVLAAGSDGHGSD